MGWFSRVVPGESAQDLVSLLHPSQFPRMILTVKSSAHRDLSKSKGVQSWVTLSSDKDEQLYVTLYFDTVPYSDWNWMQ